MMKTLLPRLGLGPRYGIYWETVATKRALTLRIWRITYLMLKLVAVSIMGMVERAVAGRFEAGVWFADWR